MEYQSPEWWKEYRRQNRTRLLEYKRIYDRQRYITHGPQEVARRKRWAESNPDKIRAQRLARAAVMAGKLQRRPCEVCGATGWVEKHHEDYEKPLEVIWLCKIHHVEADNALRLKHQGQPKRPQVPLKHRLTRRMGRITPLPQPQGP